MYMDDMSDMLHAIDGMSYDHGTALAVLDEIQYGIWTVDLPVQTVIQWIRGNPWHTYPKRRHRWRKALATQFRYMIVTVKLHYLARMATELSTGMIASEQLHELYLHVLGNARPSEDPCAPDDCTVLVPYDLDVLINALIARGVLYTGCCEKVVKLNKYAAALDPRYRGVIYID